ncbi:MAG TPA: hypothetical protein VGC97_13230 [Pyrinomonadaceae bacterium]|jgi:hypothetical protein
MWAFNEDDYQKQVFVPSIKAFNETGELPDFFARYQLALDVSDSNDIDKAFRSLNSFWNKKKQSSRFESLANALLAQEDEAKKTLTDAEARKHQRQVVVQARKQKLEERFRELDDALRMFAGRHYISFKQRDELFSLFKPKGLSEDDILSRIRVPIQDAPKKTVIDKGLEAQTYNEISGKLKTLDKRDLYDFLNVGTQATQAEIEQNCRRIEIEWSPKKADNKLAAVTSLISFVRSHIFTNGFGKYEAARIWAKVESKLKVQVRLAAIDKHIDRGEFETLLKAALDCGLDKEKAADVIESLAAEYGAAVEQFFDEETVRCGNCSAAIAKKEKKCTICGDNLWMNCPKCARLSPAVVEKCGDCEFVFSDLPQVNLLVRKAQLFLDDGELEKALFNAHEAEKLYKRQDSVDIILSKIEQKIVETEEIRRHYDEYLRERKLIAAEHTLATLISAAPKYKGRDGKTITEIQRELEVQLKQVALFLDQARVHERQKETDKAVYAYQDALRLAVDLDEAVKGLLRCPPEPAQSADACVQNGQVQVEWKNSLAVGTIEYIIVRREGQPPMSSNDGNVIGRTSSNSFRDETARPGSIVYYAVFADRGGSVSEPSVTKSVLVIREVTNFSLSAGDQIVRGTWEFPVPDARIHIYRRENTPPTKEQGEKINLSGAHSFVDSTVKNGCLYYYRILAEYRDSAGKPVYTTGLVRHVSPELPPQPVEHLRLKLEQSSILLAWQPPAHGTVSIYRSPRQPKWKPGTQLSSTELSTLGICLKEKTSGVAIDPAPAPDVTYYVPVTTAGDVVVIGHWQRYFSAQDVSFLQAQDFGNYILLQWEWTEKCQCAVVAWRSDEFPAAADDPKAVTRKISRGEYERTGGFRIESPPKDAHKFVVFAMTDINGEWVYSSGLSPGARAEVRSQIPVNVFYTLSRGTFGGLFNRRQINLKLKVDQNVANLPEIVVVAKHGDIQPLRIEDGTILTNIGKTGLSVGSEIESRFVLNGIRSPAYLRAFFVDAEAYKNFNLIEPTSSQLKIK